MCGEDAIELMHETSVTSASLRPLDRPGSAAAYIRKAASRKSTLGLRHARKQDYQAFHSPTSTNEANYDVDYTPMRGATDCVEAPATPQQVQQHSIMPSDTPISSAIPMAEDGYLATGSPPFEPRASHRDRPLTPRFLPPPLGGTVNQTRPSQSAIPSDASESEEPGAMIIQTVLRETSAKIADALAECTTVKGHLKACTQKLERYQEENVTLQAERDHYRDLLQVSQEAAEQSMAQVQQELHSYKQKSEALTQEIEQLDEYASNEHRYAVSCVAQLQALLNRQEEDARLRNQQVHDLQLQVQQLRNTATWPQSSSRSDAVFAGQSPHLVEDESDQTDMVQLSEVQEELGAAVKTCDRLTKKVIWYAQAMRVDKDKGVASYIDWVELGVKPFFGDCI